MKFTSTIVVAFAALTFAAPTKRQTKSIIIPGTPGVTVDAPAVGGGLIDAGPISVPKNIHAEGPLESRQTVDVALPKAVPDASVDVPAVVIPKVDPPAASVPGLGRTKIDIDGPLPLGSS